METDFHNRLGRPPWRRSIWRSTIKDGPMRPRATHNLQRKPRSIEGVWFVTLTGYMAPRGTRTRREWVGVVLTPHLDRRMPLPIKASSRSAWGNGVTGNTITPSPLMAQEAAGARYDTSRPPPPLVGQTAQSPSAGAVDFNTRILCRIRTSTRHYGFSTIACVP